MINIKQLVIKGIGPFQEEKFDFSIQPNHPNIHIFTGSNGTGKTTLLHSIASAFDYFEDDHEEHISNNFYKRFHTRHFPRGFKKKVFKFFEHQKCNS